MGNIMNALATAAQSMETMQRAIKVSSNNVTNARAPGHVRQTLALVGKPMSLESGLAGGLDSNGLISSRKDYLERGVHSQAHLLGRDTQRAAVLGQVESEFDITGDSGPGRSLNKLFEGFSQWSVNPNNTPAREEVIRLADGTAQDFRNLHAALEKYRRGTAAELNGAVSAINRVGGLIQSYNVQLRQDIRLRQDPGLDAQIHDQLEQLAEYTDFTVLRGEDGAVNIYLGGQTPLTLGAQFYPVSADYSTGQAAIQDSEGKDVSGQIRSGRVQALLELHNSFVPSLQAQLNTLAEAVATRVNAVSAAGVDASGQPGAALFQFNPAVGAAASLSVTGITAGQLAAAKSGAPGGNANALDLAALGSSKEIAGSSFAEYFGQIAAGAGHQASTARDDERTHSQTLAQARVLREELSAVSLDEEAATLVEFQRAYQASAELVRILNSLTETTLNILR
ncbi:MAG: flagellar hook-associated protein FlgK [Acidobacteria bacterium]|nr:flagellar hook-associated protein FlgK [Acidobacteriota bacterium]